MGNHCLETNDINEAKIHYQKATDIDQNYALAYFQLAKTLQNPSEFDQAFRNFETALEIDPSMTECHYHFANLLMKGEKLKNDGTLVIEPDLKRAESHLRKAVEIDDKFFLAHYKLGNLLCIQEKHSLSIRILCEMYTDRGIFCKRSLQDSSSTYERKSR